MSKVIETSKPYEHVMITFNVHTRHSNNQYTKKGWYEPISKVYCIPNGWENCSYGQRPSTLEGYRLPSNEIVSWTTL